MPRSASSHLLRSGVDGSENASTAVDDSSATLMIALLNMGPKRIASQRSADMIEIAGEVFGRENHAFLQRDER